MTASIEQGRDQISKLIRDALLADAAGAEIVNSDPTRLLFWNIKGDPPEVDDASSGNPLTWIKVEIRHVTGGQSTLMGDGNRRRTTRKGIVLVKCHEAFGAGSVGLDQLVKVLEQAFLKGTTAGHVWFRNVRTPEFGQDGAWFRHDVLADFQYDDVI